MLTVTQTLILTLKLILLTLAVFLVILTLILHSETLVNWSICFHEKPVKQFSHPCKKFKRHSILQATIIISQDYTSVTL